MWLGGGGCILKGLDLVVDYFKEHPELTIHIVGSIEEEFIKAYHHSFPSNVIFHGFMNVAFRSSLCALFLLVIFNISIMYGRYAMVLLLQACIMAYPIVSRWAAFDE